VRQLAERLAPGTSNLSELRADERVLTVMFLDIVGFTKLCEHRPPAEVVSFLNRFWDEIARQIEEHGGVIDKFIGDAVLALFGYNDEAEGARQAVACARELIATTERFEQDFQDTPLQVRVGINTGQLIYGDIGAARVRREFTVIGDAVNVAQRLESLAPPSSVLVSEATALLVGDGTMWSASVMANLKGRLSPVKCYVLQPTPPSPAVAEPEP